jgi:hypothetical protein
MDFEPGANVLKQYLADFPQFAADLVDLSRELSREIDQDVPLSADELAAVSAKMSRLRESMVTVETLQSASPKTFTEAAKVLGLPMQVGVAIRERRVEVATLPSRFLERLAQALKAPVTVLQSFLLLPAQASALRASKSNVKPAPAEKAPLERLLREAGIEEENISRLLHGDE